MKEATWGTQIMFDLWLAGIAGGAFFTAFLVDLLSGRKQRDFVKLATFIGVPAALLGSLLLVMDVGQQLRAWHLFTRFRLFSPMSMGSWILLIWSVTGLAMIALWFAEAFPPEEEGFFGGLASLLRPLLPAREILAWIAFLLAALLMTYTGVLLSTTNQPLWAGTLLLPALFVASAISMGIGVILLLVVTGIGASVSALLGGTGEPSPTMATQLRKALTVALAVQLVVLVGYLLWLTALSTPAAARAAGTLVGGPLAFPFWGGVVLTGLLVPLALELTALRDERRATPLTAVLSAICALFGGLILRAVVVFGGQMIL